MKLASLKRGGRDGTLVVVDASLARAVRVPEIAPTLQRAIEDWSFIAAELSSVYRLLNGDQMPGAFPFDPASAASPLPRAYQWAPGSAYLNHFQLVRRRRAPALPKTFPPHPLPFPRRAP